VTTNELPVAKIWVYSVRSETTKGKRGLILVGERLKCNASIVSSLRDSSHSPGLPGTYVPGYRLCRPSGTTSLRHLPQAVS